MNRKPSDRFFPPMSSGQQVIGICIFLFIAVVCFALGVLVGRYEPSLEEKALEQVAGNTASSAPSGNQLSPRVDTPTPTPKMVRNQLIRPEETGPRITEVPPLPPPAARVPPGPGPTPAPEAAPTPAPEAAVTPAPEATPAPASVTVNEATPVAPVPAPASPPAATEMRQEELALEPLAPAMSPAPAPAPKAEPASAGEGKWGLQLIVLSNEKRAQEFRDKVTKTAKVSATILPTKDGKMFRVAVVGYKNEAAAKSALAELKKKPEFKEALVKDFSKGQ